MQKGDYVNRFQLYRCVFKISDICAELRELNRTYLRYR